MKILYNHTLLVLEIVMNFDLNSQENVLLAVQLNDIEQFLVKFVEYYNKNSVKNFPDSLMEIVEKTSTYEVLFQIKQEIIEGVDKWVLSTRSIIAAEWTTEIGDKETVVDEYFDTLTELFNDPDFKAVIDFKGFIRSYKSKSKSKELDVKTDSIFIPS